MAGEPESLHVHEPLKARVERHDYDRLLMLSDGVFAIAITLLALELRMPEGWDGRMESLFSATGRPLLGYLFGFGLVGVFWFMHRRLFARLEQVDPVITILNLLLLGLIGLTPFVAKLIAEAGPERALPFYLVALASVFASLTSIRVWSLLHPALLHLEVDRARWRDELLYQATAALGLGGIGIWAIVNHRSVGSVGMLAIVLLLGAARRLVRHRSRRQTSSVSRP
jgi:TMEM175 potassium channel family protein